MALATSARRDQRRRLVASWNRSAAPAAESDERAAPASQATAYDDAARPERHPGLATRLPTTLGGLMLASLAILGGVGGAIAVAVSGPIFGGQLFEEGGRFASTLAVVKRAIDPRAPLPLHSWLAVLSLLLGAAIAGAIKLMRRHRRDDYNGRFRAWGWVATILSIAAWSAVVPFGTFVAAFATEATGVAIGPGGIGWWYAVAAVVLMVVLPWAILPLRHRAGAAAWTVLGMLGWSAAAGMSWAEGWVGGHDRAAIVASAAWSAGSACLLVALLTAARGVIREVLGEVTSLKPPKARRDRPRAAAAPEASEIADDHDDDRQDGDDLGSEPESDDASQADFVDGSDDGQRRLSKSERRRLRKLARMNGQAA